MTQVKKTVLGFGALVAVQAAALFQFGSHPPGPVLSDSVQVVTLICCALAAFGASRRSNALGRAFWQLAVISFTVIVVAQILQTVHDVAVLPPLLRELPSLLFVFWYGPMSIALSLDSDFEPKRFDRLNIFDFIQAFVFWAAIFLYFSQSSSHAPSAHELAWPLWQRSRIYDGILSGAFFLRAILADSKVVTLLFSRMGASFFLAGLADAYYNFPGRNLNSGSWFDIIWSLINFLPLLIAITWSQVEAPRGAAEKSAPRKSIMAKQLFALLCPLLVLGMSLLIIRQRVLLAATIMMLTSAGHLGDAARCRELGISAYLVKPIRQGELLQAICNVLNLSPKEKAPLVTRHTLRELRHRSRILLAEDNAINQTLAVRLLEKLGYMVTVAGNGAEALVALEKESIDLVLMDVQMPEMDGIEATAAIRAKQRSTGRHVPIVAMTAHALKSDEECCLSAGMDAYISKPIRIDELFATIQGLLGKSHEAETSDEIEAQKELTPEEEAFIRQLPKSKL